MIKYPVTLINVLPENHYFHLNDELTFSWQMSNFSYFGGKTSWSINRRLTTELPFLSCASIIKLKLQKIIRKNLKLCKIHVNGQTSNQTSEFHKDFTNENIWTFVLFCGYDWDTSWGGEFVCFDELNKKYQYCPFIPNTGALIPSNWDHFGNCPNSSTDKLRVTVAFSYCIPSIYNKIISDHSELKMFY